MLILKDSENACIYSVKNVFPLSEIRECKLNFCQKVIPKLEKIRLKRQFKSRNPSSAFIPTDDVKDNLYHFAVKDFIYPLETI